MLNQKRSPAAPTIHYLDGGVKWTLAEINTHARTLQQAIGETPILQTQVLKKYTGYSCFRGQTWLQTQTNTHLHMIADYIPKESGAQRAVKYSLSTANLALNGLWAIKGSHQERKTKMTVQCRMHVCLCVEEDSVYLDSSPPICVSNGLWMFPR